MEKITTLVSLSAFFPTLESLSHAEYRKLMNNYHKFLQQPLTLGMFIPVDTNNNPLEEPECYADILAEGSRVYHYDDIQKAREYDNAKSQVLFEGSYTEKTLWIEWKSFKIEDLRNCNLSLTQTALKQIYG